MTIRDWVGLAVVIIFVASIIWAVWYDLNHDTWKKGGWEY